MHPCDSLRRMGNRNKRGGSVASCRLRSRLGPLCRARGPHGSTAASPVQIPGGSTNCPALAPPLVLCLGPTWRAPLCRWGLFWRCTNRRRSTDTDFILVHNIYLYLPIFPGEGKREFLDSLIKTRGNPALWKIKRQITAIPVHQGTRCLVLHLRER